MKRVIAIATATVMTLLVAPLSVAAQQPDTRDKTIVTFSNAVELPRMRLEAGTYVFRLADTALRNVIQVLSQDGKEMLGQWLFVPAERPEVTGDTVITFRETSADSTPAVQFWYYPGEKYRQEFIYSQGPGAADCPAHRRDCPIGRRSGNGQRRGFDSTRRAAELRAGRGGGRPGAGTGCGRRRRAGWCRERQRPARAAG